MSDDAREREQLLGEVLAAPDDDAPRLVYADWLQQHGDPRGAFITLQCKEVTLPEGSPARVELHRDAEQLEQQNVHHWLPERPHQWEFRRGFLEHVVATTEFLRRHGPPIWQHEPVRSVRLHLGQSVDSAAISTLPLPSSMRAFAMSFFALDPAEVPRLFAASFVSRLHELTLQNASLAGDGARAIARQPKLSRLRALNLGGNYFGSEGAASLSRSALLTTLTRLDLDSNGIDADGAMTLFGSSNLPALEHLGLDLNPIGPEGSMAVTRSRAAKSLRSLGLSGCGIGDESVPSIAMLTSLERLDLADNALSDASVGPLLELARRRPKLRLRLGAVLPRAAGVATFGNWFSPTLQRRLVEAYGGRLVFG